LAANRPVRLVSLHNSSQRKLVAPFSVPKRHSPIRAALPASLVDLRLQQHRHSERQASLATEVRHNKRNRRSDLQLSAMHSVEAERAAAWDKVDSDRRLHLVEQQLLRLLDNRLRSVDRRLLERLPRSVVPQHLEVPNPTSLARRRHRQCHRINQAVCLSNLDQHRTAATCLAKSNSSSSLNSNNNNNSQDLLGVLSQAGDKFRFIEFSLEIKKLIDRNINHE